MNYKKLNNITGWLMFAIALTVYTLTMEVNGSLWDCGEFAGTSARLGVPHPPGAPLFSLITRLFAFLGQALGFTETAGMVFGAGALSSAFTILFLFWTITHFARKIVVKTHAIDEVGTLSTVGAFLTLASGAIGALAFTFSDSFWYSAVETEVYAMSSLCTAVVFWAALKWEDHPLNNAAAGAAGQREADKWMVLIFFIMGMSIGIHLLNILTIPPIILLFYFKRYTKTVKGTWLALGLSIVILGFVQKAVGQWSVSMAFPFDRLFVNSFGFPPITGFVFFFIIVGIAFYFLLRYANDKGLGLLRLGLWCLIFTFIGMSPYMTTMFRAKAQPGINMYSVNNPYALNGYLSREQYGDFPLLYGQTYEANQIGGDYTDDKYVLTKNENGKLEYKTAGKNYKPEYAKSDMMILPRMWYGNEENRKQFYSQWLNPKKEIFNRAENSIDDELYDTDQEAQGVAEKRNALAKQQQYVVRDHLTQKENLNWLFSYQINWMYLRYFWWNFAGKQNDIQGYSNKRDGNWISGISAIDNIRLGDQSSLPQSLKDNGAHNKLYFLPFILGVLGAVVQFRRNRNDWIVTGLLFLMTGLAIVGYLNQYGLQPRERDYAFVGSFYAFAIWIGLGVLQLYEWLSKATKGMAPVAIAAAVSLSVPLLMANVEWDDHDRSKKSTAIDLAKSYLNSCPQNAILFTIGDNDTYPLWYAQEVQGIRTDIRVVNTSLLGIDWYLNQLRYKVNKSDAFKMIWKASDYEGGKMDVLYSDPRTDNATLYSLSGLIEKCVTTSEGDRPVIGARRYYIDINQNAAKLFNLAGDTLATRIESGINQSKGYLTKGDLGILNIIAGNVNERPICFTDDNGADVGPLGIAQYLRKEGMVYRYVPSNTIVAKNSDPLRGGNRVAELESSYQRMMDGTSFGFGNAKTKGVYFDEENRRHLESIRACYAAYAQEFNTIGKTKEAAALVKKIHTEMPGYSLPYGMPSRYDQLAQTNLALAAEALEAGEKEIAKEIVLAQTKDAKEQFGYYYSLSNPGAVPSGKQLDDYISEFGQVARLFNERMTIEEGNKLQKLQNEKFMVKKMDAKTFQEMYFSYKNYNRGKELLNKLNGVVPPPPAPPATQAAASTGTAGR